MSNLNQYLQNLYNKNRLPHAILLSSPDIGLVSHPARWFAQWLLCEKRTACGHCHACQLFEANSHPDYIHIEPEGKSQSIKIDSIRHLTDFLHEKAAIDRFRVVLIEQCENMNAYSANALLKSLEEPGDDSILLLTTKNHQSLLATIRSRCQLVYQPDLANEHVDPVLLQAIVSDACVSDLASQFSEDPKAFVLQCQLLLAEVVRHQHLKPGVESAVTPLLNRIDPLACFDLVDKCHQLRAALSHKISLNPALLVEDLLIDWRCLLKGETHALTFEPA